MVSPFNAAGLGRDHLHQPPHLAPGSLPAGWVGLVRGCGTSVRRRSNRLICQGYHLVHPWLMGLGPWVGLAWTLLLKNSVV